MNIKNYKPESIQGDRFDPNSEDVSQQPDLEDEPSHPEDILPDQIEAMPGAEVSDEEEEGITARPREPVRPIGSAELPEG
jgi:hypothetical protein